MRQFWIVAAVLTLLIVAAGRYSLAQDATGTPDARSEFCATLEASPEGSPEASPEGTTEASPEIVTDASPELVASEVAEEIEEALEEVVCGTPAGGL